MLRHAANPQENRALACGETPLFETPQRDLEEDWYKGSAFVVLIGASGAAAGVSDYLPLLIDCDDETRRRRLVLDRQQRELANENMMNWARHLRRAAKQTGCETLDTTTLSPEESILHVVKRLRGQS